MSVFLFMTDLHIKPATFTDFDRMDTFILNWMEKNTVEAVVIGGDTLDSHEKICAHSLNKACNFIGRLCEKVPVFILVGNHDYINNSQFMTDNHWLNVLKRWKNVTVVDKTICKSFKGVSVVFVPYVPPGKFKEALSSVKDTPNLIFAHQEFYGCKLGCIVSTQGDVWTGCPVISGHIHERHTVGNVIYPGASVCHSTAHKSYGPCTVTLNGEISYLGFETFKETRVVQAPIFSDAKENYPSDTKIRLTGTQTDIAMSIGNPLLRGLLKKSKFLFPTAFKSVNWETHIANNLKTKAMRDDYEEICRNEN